MLVKKPFTIASVGMGDSAVHEAFLKGIADVLYATPVYNPSWDGACAHANVWLDAFIEAGFEINGVSDLLCLSPSGPWDLDKAVDLCGLGIRLAARSLLKQSAFGINAMVLHHNVGVMKFIIEGDNLVKSSTPGCTSPVQLQECDHRNVEYQSPNHECRHSIWFSYKYPGFVPAIGGFDFSWVRRREDLVCFVEQAR